MIRLACKPRVAPYAQFVHSQDPGTPSLHPDRSFGAFHSPEARCLRFSPCVHFRSWLGYVGVGFDDLPRNVLGGFGPVDGPCPPTTSGFTVFNRLALAAPGRSHRKPTRSVRHAALRPGGDGSASLPRGDHVVGRSPAVSRPRSQRSAHRGWLRRVLGGRRCSFKESIGYTNCESGAQNR